MSYWLILLAGVVGFIWLMVKCKEDDADKEDELDALQRGKSSSD